MFTTDNIEMGILMDPEIARATDDLDAEEIRALTTELNRRGKLIVSPFYLFPLRADPK
jgi:hypothetical protein